MKIAHSVIGLLLLAPCLSLAEPTTQPANERPRRPLFEALRQRFGGGQGGGAGGNMSGPMSGAMSGGGFGERDAAWRVRPSDEEVDQIIAFCKENMPEHYALWSKIPEKSPAKRMFPFRVVAGFRIMERARVNDTDLYEVMLRQVKLRDQMLGVVAKNTDADPDALAAITHDTAKEIVDVSLNQRALRLERMKRLIAEQEEKLELDRKETDRLVARQSASAAQEFREMLRRIERIQQRGERGPAEGKDQRRSDAGDVLNGIFDTGALGQVPPVIEPGD